MFHDDDDEDFNFDLDDVVPAKKAKILNSPPVCNNRKDGQLNVPLMTSTQSTSSSQQVTQEDWGSDDDDLAFLDVEASIPTSSQDEMENNKKEGYVTPSPQSQISVRNFSTSNQNVLANKKLDQNVTPVPQSQACVRKFPGPAGLISNRSIGSKKTFSNFTEPSNKEFCEGDMDTLYGWSKAMSMLGLEDTWRAIKTNIKWIKNTFLPCSYVSIKVPFLVVGLKCIQSAKNDVNCIVQDSTGETRSTIHQAVVEEHGKKIKAGAVLLLRRPAVLISGPCPHLVTVTKKSLLAIVVAHAGGDHAMTRCSHFSRSDVQSWSSEETECEELADRCDDDESPSVSHHQGPRLFTSHYSTTSPAYGSSHLKAPTSRTASSAAIRSSASPLQRRPVTTAPVAASASSLRTQAPSSNHQNAARPSVRFQPPPSAPSIPSVNQSKLQPPPATDNQFIEQFLDGVDTDALFDDF